MRIFVVVAVVLQTLVWLGAVTWLARAHPSFDVSGLHGTMLFLVLPAAVLGAVGRWLPLAVGLVCLSAFIWLSVLAASQISN